VKLPKRKESDDRHDEANDEKGYCDGKETGACLPKVCGGESKAMHVMRSSTRRGSDARQHGKSK